jgi:LuxR family transcriptional regulator, maltose regulon positive regulatory protein
MPKAAAYLLIWLPEREVYELRESQSNQVVPVTPGSHAWFAWLAAAPSFTFSGRAGQLTVRQEVRPRGGAYWYACRRTGKKMTKRYLGRTAELTPARLEEVAAQLAEAALARSALHAEVPTKHILTSLMAPLPDTMAAREASFPPPFPQFLSDGRLATKLQMPHLRPRLVQRTHLIKHLQQGREAPLTLISAPAGCGKTTLLAQWLAQRGKNVAWLSLEPEDNEPVRFLSSVIAALQTLDPHLGSSALALLHITPPAPPPPPEAVLAQLAVDLLERAQRNITLVLDDYHLITTESLQRAVTALMEHSPPQFHLIIATRVDPALPLARLRARGQLCEVRAAQLQFSTEEAGAFLKTVMELDVSAEAVAALQSGTEGWIAGLQLAALSLQGSSDPHLFLANFSGSHRHIVDYLVEEVLARQPKAVQAFLLQTSILDRLTGPLCDAVTEGTHSDVLLEQLERANLFLVPLDERRQWYRYHHLFAEMLRARLQREAGTKGLATLYTRASRWYEQNGMPAEAVETALAAADFTRAADLIAPLVVPLLRNQQANTLQHWLERFPQAVLYTQAFLCLAYAYSLFFSTIPQTQTHEAPLAVAERLFDAEGNRTGLGQIAALRAMDAMVRGDGAHAIAFGQQALHQLPPESLLERSAGLIALAEGYQFCGEVASARRMVAEARSLHEQTGNVGAVVGGERVLGDLLVMEGKLQEAGEIFAQVCNSAGKWQHFTIQALMGLGTIARERNELEKAEAFLEQAIDIARKTRDPVLLARAVLLRARVIQARGEDERTRATFAEALELAQQCRYVGLMEQAQAYQARNWLGAGHLAAALQWQAACALTRATAPTYEREASALTLVRVLLAQEEAEEALLLLDRWRQYARTQGRTGSEIEMLVLAALAHQRQGKIEQAVQRLQPAILLASPERNVRVFVDEGTPMVALLSLVLFRWKSKPEASFLHTLLSVLQAEHPAQGSLSPSAPHGEPPREPFTDRERKVLRLLAAGLSNAEIAAELVVSINTIRTQARSIYQKLNAKNRHEAVALARHWRLL